MAAQPKDIPVVKEADASGADTSYLSQSAPSPRSADFSFSSPMLLNLMMASSPPTRRAGRSDSTSSSNGINGFDQPSGSTLGRSAGAASSVSTSPPLTPPDISGADTVTIPTSPMSAQTPATDSKASDYNYFWTRHGRRASADASVHLPEQQSPTGVANWLSRLPKTSTLASPPLGSPTSPKDSFNLLSRFGVGNSKVSILISSQVILCIFG